MGRDISKLVKLEEAARQLGCHVETLRIRIRAGSLKAVRGPHGAYYIAPECLKSLAGIRRVKPAAQVTPEAMEQSWALIERDLSRPARALLRAARREMEGHQPLYRVVSVHRLAALGLNFNQIAAELRITARHARRIYRSGLPVGLKTWWQRRWRGLLASRLGLKVGTGGTEYLGTRRARRVLASMRAKLEAAGVQRHLIVRGRRYSLPEPTTAFKTTTLYKEDVSWLRSVGLSDQEMQAIREVGIGSDELHALLLDAIRAWELARSTDQLHPDRDEPAS